MGKLSVFSKILVILLAIILAGCGGVDGGPERNENPVDQNDPSNEYESARLDNIYLMIAQDYSIILSDPYNFENERVSFSEGSEIGIYVNGANLSRYNLVRLYVKIKKGEDIIVENDYSMNVAGAQSVHIYQLFWQSVGGYWPMNEAGDDYTAEAYVVDANGNRSNIITKAFTVN